MHWPHHQGPGLCHYGPLSSCESRVKRWIVYYYNIVSYVRGMVINPFMAFSRSGWMIMLPRSWPWHMWIKQPHGFDLKPLRFKNDKYTQFVIRLISGGLSVFFNSSGFNVQTYLAVFHDKIWQCFMGWGGLARNQYSHTQMGTGWWVKNPVYFPKK